MPSLPGPIASGTLPDGTLVTAANLWSNVGSVINAIRNRINPKTSIWQGVLTAAGQTIPDSTFLDCPLDTTTVDTDGLGISSSGYRAPATGIYLVSGRVVMAGSVTGARLVATIANNGSRSSDGIRSTCDTSGTSDTRTPTAWSLMSLSRGAVVTVQAWQNSLVVGGPASMTLGRCALTVVRWS